MFGKMALISALGIEAD